MVILIINYLISASLLLYWLIKKKTEDILYKGVFLLFLPLMGTAYIVISYCIFRNIKKSESRKEYSIQDVYNTENPKKEIKINREKIVDLVPLEEALLINSKDISRKLLLNIIKEDMEKKIDLINLAIKSNDMETAHYAATAISEIKRRLKISVYSSMEAYKNNNDVSSMIKYAHALRDEIKSGFLDETELARKQGIYRNILINIISVDKSHEDIFVELIKSDIEKKHFDSAYHYCKIFMKNHGNSEKPYVMYLKIFYESYNNIGFYQVIDYLIKSRVSITHETWNLIRLWKVLK